MLVVFVIVFLNLKLDIRLLNAQKAIGKLKFNLLMMINIISYTTHDK